MPDTRAPTASEPIAWTPRSHLGASHTADPTDQNRLDTANRALLARRMRDPDLAHLNRDQRRAVIIHGDRTLVMASAGTGKTHAMVAKARDAVRTGIATPEQIAFVTFTRRAATEIARRTADLPGMTVGTLHHLARTVIARSRGRQPTITPLAHNDAARFRAITDWIETAVTDDPTLVVELAARRQLAQACTSPDAAAPGPFPARSPDSRQTIQVETLAHAQIASVLYLCAIPFRYRSTLAPIGEDTAWHRPAFHLPGHNVWLEHFPAVARAPVAPQSSAPTHDGGLALRTATTERHRSLNTRWTATSDDDLIDTVRGRPPFSDVLTTRLAALDIPIPHPPHAWPAVQILQALRTREGTGALIPLAAEIDAWIRTTSQQPPHLPWTDRLIRDSDTAIEAATLARLSQRVRGEYAAHLDATGALDHEGTILEALRLIETRDVTPTWKVVIVDEYQDVNRAQAALIHALLDPTDPDDPSTRARLTAIGDDWQSIMAFQGGDVDLIRTLEDPRGHDTTPIDRAVLRPTYRFGQPTADATAHFATRDPNATRRTMIGATDRPIHPRWPAPIVVASTTPDLHARPPVCAPVTPNTTAVAMVVERIAEQAGPDSTLLVLGRKNADIAHLEIPDTTGSAHADTANEKSTTPEPEPPAPTGLDRNAIRTLAKHKGIEVEFRTIHSAKGTESDYVILIDTGRPRAGDTARARALERALRAISANRDPDAEERRLWYVALTRARHKVYILVDDTRRPPSHFAEELYQDIKGAYHTDDGELAGRLIPLSPGTPCPACQSRPRPGTLHRAHGSRGPYIACTNNERTGPHRCSHNERRCAQCGHGLMHRIGNGWARCDSGRCRDAPVCRCTIPLPMVPRTHPATGRRFWGCQSYGHDQSCRSTYPWIEETPPHHDDRTAPRPAPSHRKHHSHTDNPKTPRNQTPRPDACS